MNDLPWWRQQKLLRCVKRLKRILQTAEVTEGHHHFVTWSAVVLLRAARISKWQTVWVMRLTNQLGQQKVKTPQASWGGAEGSCQHAWPNNTALCFTWLLPVPRLFVVTTKKEADVESQKPTQWCYLAARKKEYTGLHLCDIHWLLRPLWTLPWETIMVLSKSLLECCWFM